MKVEENIPLKNFSTLRVGGPARFFVSVETTRELKDAILFAHEKRLPFFILGGGSNVFFSDEGFSGVVIRISICGMKFESGDGASVRVTASAGENWDAFVAETVRRNLYGLENLSFIPGSVGATPIQNIGAYGSEVKETIVEVIALDTEKMETRTFSNSECHFGYRDSFFKTSDGKKFVVISVVFELRKSGKANIEYKDLKKYFEGREEETISLSDVRRAVTHIRKKKLPDPEQVGTLGSFFKNPIVSAREFYKLQSDFPEMPFYESGTDYKIPAAWLIDNVCGLKGYTVENVKTHDTQPLAIVNTDGASAEAVRNFSEFIRRQVKEKANIVLEYEINFV